MNRYSPVLMALLALTVAPEVRAAADWTEGKHYVLVESMPRATLLAGKVEVTEVFSYGCPACAQFNPIVHKLRQSLPAEAKLVYVPASFNRAEDWPMFQRAYCTAEVLGIAERTHDGMFDAVWKTGELAITDPVSGRIKNPLPTIEDAARYYNGRTGVKVEDFIAAATSFSVDVKMKAADDFIRVYRVDHTPTIIVNQKYRLDVRSAGGYDELVELVKWLVAKDRK